MSRRQLRHIELGEPPARVPTADGFQRIPAPDARIPFELKDASYWRNNQPVAVRGEIHLYPHMLSIQVDGYEEYASVDHLASEIVHLECWGGRLQVLAASDVNAEDVVIVDMEQARSECRKPDD